jgi:iron only hydrogenase large subunit-like protein
VLPRIIEERRRLAQGGLKFYIANSCPVVVSLVNRKYPHLRSYLFPGLSPMLSHAALLKKRFGGSTKVLFIGPCGAKKREAAANPGLVDYALTFREVKPWVEEKYGPAWQTRSLSLPGCGLDPGLNHARQAVLAVAAGGRQAVEAVLDRLPEDPPGPFLELLGCPSGCLGGPGMPNGLAMAERRRAVERYVAWIEEEG